MKRFSKVQGCLAAIACFSMLLPHQALAAQPVAGQLPDVALSADGTLRGQVISPQGMPQASQTVAILHAGQQVAVATTDAQGVFVASGLKGGVYQLQTTTGQSVCRAWANNTAPPHAAFGVMMVQGDAVRGQCATGGCAPACGPCGGGGGLFGGGGWFSNPWILAAVVATAIAVPIAVADNDSGS